MGIEPTSEAWEASILPLNYARSSSKGNDSITLRNGLKLLLVATRTCSMGSSPIQSRCKRTVTMRETRATGSLVDESRYSLRVEESFELRFAGRSVILSGGVDAATIDEAEEAPR
jgi:hypothetical protein